MDQWLPRGTEIQGTAIRKLLAEDTQWQIYDTRTGSYVLAVKKDLLDIWSRHFSDVDNLFFPLDGNEEISIIPSTRDYLISSLDKGPYPANASQLEAFAGVFRKESSEWNLDGAIYIEEYSLLLPTNFNNNNYDNNFAFGKWITGGVEVSAENTEVIRNHTSWIPEKTLCRTFELADVKVDERKKTKVEKDDPEERSREGIPSDRFSLVGRQELENFLNDHIIDVLRKPEEYKRMGIGFPGASILYGPPGSGKTFAIEKLAEYLDWPRFDINSESIGSPYIHETGKKISQVFDDAIRNAPSIVVIDEMESYLSERKGNEQHHVEEVAEFLRKIPEAIENHVLVFAMTNLLENVDPAIRRRGRFDYIIEVGMASTEEIKSLLEDQMKNLPIEQDVRVDSIADSLSSHPLSDVTFVLREAGRSAVKAGKDRIDMECFGKAISLLPERNTKKSGTIGFRVD